MKALRFQRFGEVNSVLRVEEVPTPVPAPDDVLVRIEAASINPADVKNVQGKFGQTTLPRIPGRDFAGVVVGGKADMVGREVWATGGDIGFTRDGCHAEYIVIPAKGARAMPASLSMVEAASVGTNYVTAFLGLMEKAKLREGETVLVTGALGGVGSSVMKIAKTRSARLVGVERKASDLEKVRGLADLGLAADSGDIAARVKEFTQGRGADVVFDCVGGPLFEVGLRSLGLNGRQVNITVVGDRRVSFDLLDFYRKQLTLFGLNTATLDTVASGDILDRLGPSFDKGEITPPALARTCSLEEAVNAYAAVGEGAAGGKIVIVFPRRTP